MRIRLEPSHSLPIVLFATLLSSLAWAGTTIHVPADQPTIQAGMDAAVNGDIVMVSPGTYYEHINFNGKAITVTSSGGPQVTIIDASQSSGATVTFSSGETAKSILSGFTLQNGLPEVSISSSSPTVQGNAIGGGNSTYYYGDGIYSQFGAPLIQGNLIVGNPGNGISASSDLGMKVIGNVIGANGNSGINTQYAGGLDLIQQNTILENSYTGIFYFPSSVGGNGQFIQNLIYGNGSYGANLQAPFTMISNTISGNNAGCCGNSGEIWVALNGATTIQNNLIISQGSDQGVFCQEDDSTSDFTNNDVYSAGGPAYGSSCIDRTGANGNISVDPIFSDVLSHDYHLQSSSPVLGAGTISAGNEPKTDFDGDPRTINNAIDIGADEYRNPSLLYLSSRSLHFGEQDVSTTSAAQTITFTNNAKAAVTIRMIAAGPNFSQTNTCGTSLPAGANCQISISFSPLVGGPVAGVLGVFTSATANPEAVTLFGTGLAPQIQYGCCFNFWNEVIGTTTTQSVNLTNDGLAPLLISSVTWSGSLDFVETNNCPTSPNSLGVGASCSLTLTFAPTVAGNEGGVITVTSNAAGTSPLYVNGSSASAGIPVLSLNNLNFPLTLIGQSSAPQTVTLTNGGTGPLGISNIYSYGDFPQTNNCPGTLAVNAGCTISVAYTPSVQGTETGTVSINTDGAISSISINLSGAGAAPVPSISSLSIVNAPTGGADTMVTITGAGFVGSSQVLWNGVPINYCCSWVSGTTFTFTIPSSDLLSAGTSEISVSTPEPGGGTSNSIPFTVYSPFNYASKPTTYSYRTISGTNLNLYSHYSSIFTTPFPIQYGGGTYSTITVNAEGTISFSNFGSSPNNPLPISWTTSVIAPFWTYNLYPFGNGNDNNVFWDVIGTAPNRQLVVEWRDVGMCCETTNTVRFEVVFFEGNSNILFNYADTVFGGAYASYDNGAGSTVGVQVSTTTATQYSYNQASLASKTAILWYPNNPMAALSTSTVGFGYHQVGTLSLAQAVTLTNGGVSPLIISSMSIDNPDFTETSNCGTTLGSHKSCTIKLFFKPSQPTNETGSLTISDNATNSPQTVALSGTGTVTGVTVFPILVNFGSVAVNTTASAPVTLANGTNQPLTIQQITATPSVFTDSSNCGASVAPGQACTVTVNFTPTQLGSVQGILSMGLNGKAVKPVSQLVGSGK